MREDYLPGTDVSLKGIKEAFCQALEEKDIDTIKGLCSLSIDKIKKQLPEQLPEQLPDNFKGGL